MEPLIIVSGNHASRKKPATFISGYFQWSNKDFKPLGFSSFLYIFRSRENMLVLFTHVFTQNTLLTTYSVHSQSKTRQDDTAVVSLKAFIL